MGGAQWSRDHRRPPLQERAADIDVAIQVLSSFSAGAPLAGIVLGYGANPRGRQASSLSRFVREMRVT
jgi:hypothetical protein